MYRKKFQEKYICKNPVVISSMYFESKILLYYIHFFTIFSPEKVMHGHCFIFIHLKCVELYK